MKKIKAKIDKVIEWIALHFIFIFGIGITCLVAKLFSKKFLIKNQTNSSWKNYLTNKNPIKMY